VKNSNEGSLAERRQVIRGGAIGREKGSGPYNTKKETQGPNKRKGKNTSKQKNRTARPKRSGLGKKYGMAGWQTAVTLKQAWERTVQRPEK